MTIPDVRTIVTKKNAAYDDLHAFHAGEEVPLVVGSALSLHLPYYLIEPAILVARAARIPEPVTASIHSTYQPDE